MDKDLEERVRQYRRKRSSVEFFKSTVIFFLAITLLVGAVLAWFSTSNTAIIEPIILSINSGTVIEVGSEVVEDKVILLPCATKWGTVTAAQFSRALKIETFRLESSNLCNVAITVAVPQNSGLYCYIDVNYTSTRTAADYAGNLAKTNNSFPYHYASETPTTVFDSSTNVFSTNTATGYTFQPSDYNGVKYEKNVAIVFWADYDIVGDSIPVQISVDIEFKATE